MKLTTVLFDLDGTLLPMDQDAFVKAYFGLLAKKLAPHGYEPDALIQSVWAGTAAMVKNDGTKTNEEVFWDHFSTVFGENARADEPLFARYYEEDFPKVQAACGFEQQVKPAIDAIKAMGLQVILATNPIFPAIATRQRIAWAGLSPEDFQYITTYENSSYCKPNPQYYREILDRFGLDPQQCLMVGNDAKEDMLAASQAGIKGFLLPRCLINSDGLDITQYPQGDLKELLEYISKLTAVS